MIEGEVAKMRGGVAHNEEISHQIDQKYRILEDVGAGQSLQSAMAFQQDSNRVRQQTRDLVEQVASNVSHGADDMDSTDNQFVNIVG
ncbi:hypothetical protein [Mycobacteroides abscessus]|nr:hypothetical protein [Mycobacteroides abscessus]